MKNITSYSDNAFQIGDNIFPLAYNLISDNHKGKFTFSLVNIYDKNDVLFNDIPLEEVAIGGQTYNTVEELQTAFDVFRVNFNSAGGSAELPTIYTQKFIYSSGLQQFAVSGGGNPQNVLLNRAPLIQGEEWTFASTTLTIDPSIELAANDEIYVTGIK